MHRRTSVVVILLFSMQVPQAMALEVSSVAAIDSPQLVAMPSGQTYVLRRAEVEVAAGESEFSFDYAANGLDEQGVQLRVIGASDDISISGRYRRADVPGKIFWRLSSAKQQNATLRLCCTPKDLAMTVAYEAILGERMDLRGYVTIVNGGKMDMETATVRLPSGDCFTANLSAGTTVTQDLLNITEMPYTQQYVYDEAAHGKHVTRIIEFTSPRPRPGLPAGVISFYAGEPGTSVILGQASIPFLAGGTCVKLAAQKLPDISVTGGMTESVQQSIKTDVYKKLAFFDQREEYEYRLRNHSGASIDLLFRAHYAGDWKIQKSSHDHARTDATTVEWQLRIPAGEELTLGYEVLNRKMMP